jgi:hypothetical protein
LFLLISRFILVRTVEQVLLALLVWLINVLALALVEI